ncbi:MAG: hypothetical protein QOK11_282 [Pseudonocardiales bacterium]|nr:hypothetical protein [Pseudonocardiales bacterium]
MRAGGSHRVRSGRRDTTTAQLDHLARFSGASLTDADVFGGGFEVAAVGMRAQTVAYGYLAVVEEYEHPACGARWCTLAVTLPNAVPFLALDHRAVLGQPGVPVPGRYPSRSGDADLDAAYVITADDALTVGSLLTRELRDVLVRRPMQRLMYSGARLLLRTFDGAEANPQVTAWLRGVAGAVLAATPGFVSRLRTPDAGPGARPFPRGLHGAGDG